VEDEFAPIIAEVVVKPEKEEFVLHEYVEIHISRPKGYLVSDKRERPFEQIAHSFFEWDSEECLDRRSIISP
jgi:hypothetical protein